VPTQSRFDFYRTNDSNLRFDILQKTLVMRCALLHNLPELRRDFFFNQCQATAMKVAKSRISSWK